MGATDEWEVNQRRDHQVLRRMLTYDWLRTTHGRLATFVAGELS